MARDGGACVYALPYALKNAFIGMVKAFKPNYVITTHDKADEIKQSKTTAKVVSLFSELSQVPSTITADWLDEVMFDDVQITQSDEMAVIQAQKVLLQQKIAHLATLDEMSLQLSLRDVVKEFGVPKDFILKCVADHKRGDFIQDTPPHDTPVTHDEVYNELYQLIDNHMIIDEPYKVAFVLWVVFTYLVDIAEYAPIAWITAPERACGKSTLLGLFGRVVDKPFLTANITSAVLYRITEQYQPTLLLDEIDTWIKPNQELLGLVNAGYERKAAQSARCNDTGGIDVFKLFGARVCCGIGGMQGTFASRAIKFALRRKTNHDKPVKGVNKYDLPNSTTDKLKPKIKRWANDNRQAVDNAIIRKVDELKAVSDRDFNNWYILLQIASVLGVYDKAVQSCLVICHVEHEPSVNEQLLSNIRDSLGDKPIIGTSQLLESLLDNPEWLWASYNKGQPLTHHQMAKRLKDFGVTSKNGRVGGIVAKCYYAKDLQPIFDSYLAPKTNDTTEMLF